MPDASLPGTTPLRPPGRYLRKYVVRGREKFGYVQRRQDSVKDIVKEAMGKMDIDGDGVVSEGDFMEWSRLHNIENLVDDWQMRNVFTNSMMDAQ